jgi:hypothetical protein
MYMKIKTLLLLALTVFGAFLLPRSTAQAQGTAFTYQGRLNRDNSPVNGSYDLAFTLYNNGTNSNPGDLLAGPVTNRAVAVTNGLFTTVVDFGPGVFTGAANWLEVAVSANALTNGFTPLTPRQLIAATPYAILAGGVSGPVSGSSIVVGSIPDSGLSTNVALRTGGNTFSGTQVVTNGNVGIGTTAPSTRLEVTGTVKATAFVGGGAGLSNIPASSVTGVIAPSQIATPPPGMAYIPAGAFTLGDPFGGLGDALATNVTLSGFYMDVNLVTLSQWQSVFFWATNGGYGFKNSGWGKGLNHPVQTVDWYDCVKWSNARSQQAGRAPVYYTDAGLTAVYTNGEPSTIYVNWAADGYRLPTESEWEKAARGGVSRQRFPWGNVINQNLANYYASVGGYDLGPSGYNGLFLSGGEPYTSPAGSFAANGYGLNDMAGNVFEWCWDWYAGPPYPTGSPYLGGTDPRGPTDPSGSRVLRGGSWYNSAESAQCAKRGDYGANLMSYSLGFRCVKGL